MRYVIESEYNMLTKEQYLNLHDQFYDAFVASSFSSEGYLQYDHYVIGSDRSMGPRWLIFHSMAKDLVRELLNTINGFYTSLIKLDSWNTVLDRCEEDYRNDFIFEIISPFASYNLNYVSIGKQRIIYASCMLSHQTLMLIDPSIQDSDLVEHTININSLNAYSDRYNYIVPLLRALNQIDNQAFRDITSNYRNLYHHRIPPNFELGLSGFISRIVNGDGRVSYGLGGRQPLRLGELIPALYEQHQASVSTFQVFWNLVEEQVSIWEREAPNTT